MKLKPEDVAVGGEFPLLSFIDDGVVTIETVLLVLDEFLTTKVVERSSKYGFLGLVSELPCSVLPQLGRMLDPSDKAAKIASLFFSKWRRRI